MKKTAAWIMLLSLAFALIGYGNTQSESAPESPNAMVPSIIVDGILYRITEKQIPAEVDESAIAGRITSVVPLSQMPTQDVEANFGKVGDPYAWTEDGLLVIFGNEWTIFESAGQ